MAEIVIRCPHCDKGLKLRDSSKLGKKAQCPKCGHNFVMQQPTSKRSRPAAVEEDEDEDEVEFQLADAPAVAQPVVGKAARRIPDPAPVATITAPRPGELPDLADADPPTPRTGGRGRKRGKGFSMPKISLPKLSKKQIRQVVALGVSLVVIVGGLFAALNSGTPTKSKGKKQTVAAQGEEIEEEEEAGDDTATTTAVAATPVPIDTWGLPMGCRAIISVRPSEMWKSSKQLQEFRNCLPDLAPWAEKQLKAIARFDLAKVDHILVGFVPGEVGTAPQMGAVVRFSADMSPSQFIIDFPGKEDRSQGYPVYIGDTHTFMRKPQDLKTVAICPNGGLSQAMAEGAQGANPQSIGIDALLPKTDQNKHLSIIFEPRSVRRHQEKMFLPVFQDVVTRVLDWFNDDEIETVAWSLQLGEKNFESKFLLRNQTGFSEQKLEKDMKQRLKDLPFDLWHAVEKMNPQTAGFRQIIGRYPAMMQVYAKSTKSSVGPRLAILETSLPERAAPNLALGSILAWDESTRTDFTKSATPGKGPSTGSDNLPELVADRLKRKIEIEFNRYPLQEAIKYIAEECKVGHDIDGDALKFKGYTKNMPQTFNMNDTGFAALKMIFSKYDDMCLVIDEKKKEFLVTTRPFAKDKGLTVFEIP